jgi:hypothetical protein
MLIFVDESGDSGLEIERGASRFFTIALVVFEDHDDAIACDQRIELLKKELGWDREDEFHFKRNSDRIRKTFLKAVSPYNFFYYGIVLNKDPRKLWGEGFKDKKSFYKYACSLVFQNAKEKLERAIVVLDESGSLDFKRQLERYLKGKMNEPGRCLIKEIKMQRSKANNLLQLADYVAGTINRAMKQGKKVGKEYKEIISHREIYVQIWPK